MADLRLPLVPPGALAPPKCFPRTPRVGSGVGSCGGSWEEIAGATGTAINGGTSSGEAPGSSLMQYCIPVGGIPPHHIALLRVGGWLSRPSARK